MTSKINEKNTRKRESALERSKGGENPRIRSVKAAKPVGCDPHAAYADGIVLLRQKRRQKKGKNPRKKQLERGREPS